MPESLAAQLLDIATYLDAIPPLDFVQNPEEPKRLESLMVTYESESKGKVREIITLTEGDWKKAEEIADKFYEEIVSHLSERQAKLILTELWEEIL